VTDLQDPLPEASFFYRRLLTFGSVAACLLLVWRLTYVIPENDALGLCQALLLFSALMVVLYAAGASAGEIFGLLANLKLRLRGPRPAEPPTVQTEGD
jgi:hypothetical protein